MSRDHAHRVESECMVRESCTAMAEQKSSSAQAPERPGLSHQTAPPVIRYTPATQIITTCSSMVKGVRSSRAGTG